ncbi:WbqC family protein [Flavobacterium sp.]|uniref:WbqC family protein n=1 Tax=Flavobacterium sp. TaxID=239 RepID=UPI0038FD37EF
MDIEIKVAIMQPYIFPYIGYFQLINSVDKFIFYDDVNFIKGGWINRNRILSNGKENLFTVPLDDASSFKQINATGLNPRLYAKWKLKFFRTISQSYSKALYYQDVYPLLEKTFDSVTTISELSINSVKLVCDYLCIDTKFYLSSSDFPGSKGMEREDRLVHVCRKSDSKHYINMIAGSTLYTKDSFLKNGIVLNFLKPIITEYPQKNKDFVEGLSIIDVLMFNSKQEVKEMLNKFILI